MSRTAPMAQAAWRSCKALTRAPLPDLVILDLMLPDMDGLEVCRRIRALQGPAAQVPVLMLTAKGDPMDRIIGLELGADDYLPKPFEPRELLARIRAILRRAPTAAARPPRRPSAALWHAGDRPRRAHRHRGGRGRPTSPPTSLTCWWRWPSAPAAC
jgi:DNA-binding response OmpR family regulator